MGGKRCLLVIICSVLLITTVSAHVPQTSEDNESLDTAMHVHDPTKSWVIYSELHDGGEAQYYEMELDVGDRLKLSLLLPEDEGFVPNLVIMGTNLADEGDLPNYIDKPEDYGHVVVNGVLGEREYEPFTPASYYFPAEYEMEIENSDTYYVAVFSEGQGGRYGLAVGYEERYGIVEWISVPIDVVNIHVWEGQPLLLVLTPMILVFAFGFGILIWSNKMGGQKLTTLPEWTAASAALLFIGSGAMMLTQMMIAISKGGFAASAALTVVFVILPIILATFILLLIKNVEGHLNLGERSKLIAYGILGLVVWAGLIIGPILLFVSVVLPKDISSIH